MAEQHRATLETWTNIRAKASLAEIDPPSDWDYCQGMTELRDRVLTMDACIRDIYEQLDRLKTLHESNWSRIVKLEEGPAVAETRGPGSVGPMLATDTDLMEMWHTTEGSVIEALRAIYKLGLEHGAAIAKSQRAEAEHV